MGDMKLRLGHCALGEIPTGLNPSPTCRTLPEDGRLAWLWHGERVVDEKGQRAGGSASQALGWKGCSALVTGCNAGGIGLFWVGRSCVRVVLALNEKRGRAAFGRAPPLGFVGPES